MEMRGPDFSSLSIDSADQELADRYVILYGSPSLLLPQGKGLLLSQNIQLCAWHQESSARRSPREGNFR